MDSSLAAAYAELSEKHWWWRARRLVLGRELARLFPDRQDCRILEVGCASGANFDMLAAHGSVVGLEPDPLLRGTDDRILPLALDGAYRPAAPVDLVAMLDVLEHVEDRAGFLGEAKRLLQPAGHLLLTVPAHGWLWTRHDDANDHLVRYSRRGLERELSQAGFGVLRTRFFFPSLVPAKLAVRWGERLRAALGPKASAGSAERTRQESKPPRLMAEPWNALAAGWLNGEDRALGFLGLPFGGSLLAVARPR